MKKKRPMDMSEINDLDYVIHRFAQNVLLNSINLHSKISNEKAQKYLSFGYVIRLHSLIMSRNELFQLLKEDGGEYNTNAILYTVYVNSIYINMFGALDNLAWTLHHEFNLVEEVTENKHRTRIGLFAKEWTYALKQKDQKIVEDINKFKDWYDNCKDFRDPSAHRLPLYCPPIIQTEEDQAKSLDLSKKLESMDVDDRSYMDVFWESKNQGIYKSWFCVNSEESTKFFSIDRVVFNDYKSFLELSDLITKWLGKMDRLN